MDWLHPITIFFLITLIILLVLKMGHFWNYSSQITVLLPGPKPLPILGNLHIIDQERPHRTMLKLSKVYGPVFSIQMGFQKMVVLTGYEMVKEALVNQADAFAERPIIPMFEEFSNGFGLTLSHGKNWKVMQRFTLSTLRDYGMGKRSIEDKIVEECSILTKKLESYKGKPLETTTVMNAAVASIIVSILLGRRYEYEDPIFRRLLELINQNVRVFGSPSVLEKSNNINGYFHNENLKTLVANLFAAGMETTSTTLRWALLLMMKHPEIQCKVQEEIAVTIGSAQPRAEHRKKMPYTDAVIHEVQRYANIIPTNLPHATTKDITLKGYFIPKVGGSVQARPLPKWSFSSSLQLLCRNSPSSQPLAPLGKTWTLPLQLGLQHPQCPSMSVLCPVEKAQACYVSISTILLFYSPRKLTVRTILYN
ncbi:cytochrome P450 2K4 isoform X2 [Anolis carolinensis]|uniref:cytochrome P450 2K4 isoform X2 n=1 Tax=Anolis carolinensis TaxID=28377 RepID=UPI002F2B5A59